MWKLLDKFDVFISDVVIQEASRGDESQAGKRLNALKSIPILKIDDDAKELAKALLAGKAIPEKCP